MTLRTTKPPPTRRQQLLRAVHVAARVSTKWVTRRRVSGLLLQWLWPKIRWALAVDAAVRKTHWGAATAGAVSTAWRISQRIIECPVMCHRCLRFKRWLSPLADCITNFSCHRCLNSKTHLRKDQALLNHLHQWKPLWHPAQDIYSNKISCKILAKSRVARMFASYWKMKYSPLLNCLYCNKIRG